MVLRDKNRVVIQSFGVDFFFGWNLGRRKVDGIWFGYRGYFK